MILLILLNLFILNAEKAIDHDVHVSICDMHYNEKTDRLEIRLNLFLDDFEYAMTNKGFDPVHLCTEIERDSAEIYLQAYLNEKFVIYIDEEVLELDFIGKEISADLASVDCYLESKKMGDFHTLSIKNALFIEIYEDQKNIVRTTGISEVEDFFLLNNIMYRTALIKNREEK